MQAISTKFLGPAGARGARVGAKSASGESIAVSYDHALDERDNHHRAAKALMSKLGWTGRLVGGSTRDGYCWVFAEGSRDRARPRATSGSDRDRPRRRRR